MSCTREQDIGLWSRPSQYLAGWDANSKDHQHAFELGSDMSMVLPQQGNPPRTLCYTKLAVPV